MEASALGLSAVRWILVARDPQDMRRGIDTLASVVEHPLGHGPCTGDGIIILRRDRQTMKVPIREQDGPSAA